MNRNEQGDNGNGSSVGGRWGDERCLLPPRPITIKIPHSLCLVEGRVMVSHGAPLTRKNNPSQHKHTELSTRSLIYAAFGQFTCGSL